MTIQPCFSTYFQYTVERMKHGPCVAGTGLMIFAAYICIEILYYHYGNDLFI